MPATGPCRDPTDGDTWEGPCEGTCACTRQYPQWVCTHVYPRWTPAAWIALWGEGGITPGSDTGPHQGRGPACWPRCAQPARGTGAGAGAGHSQESQGTLRCRFQGGRLHPGGADHVSSLHSGGTGGAPEGPSAARTVSLSLGCPVALCPPPPGPRSRRAGKACLCSRPVVAADTEGTVTCRGPSLSSH